MFEVPQEVFDTYKLAMDAMINTNFGITCTLIYPATQSVCTNCLFDSINGKSSNVYNGTGPISFSGTLCPYCNGDGFTASEITEDIKLRCYFTPKSWIKISGVDVKVPDGAMQTIGHMVDLPKCRRASYLVANTSNPEFGNYRYKMFSEALPHGFKRQDYFIAMWSRMP